MSVETYFYKGDFVDFIYTKGNINVLENTFHGFYELYFSIDGNVQFVNNSNCTDILKYQLVIIPAGEYHFFRYNKNAESNERCIINIREDFLTEDTRKYLDQKKVLSFNKESRITKNILYLKQMYNFYDDKDYKSLLNALVTDIVLFIKHNGNNDGLEVTDCNLDSMAFEMIKYIDDNITENLTISQIANAFYISVSSACHIFKNAFDISIKKYILEKRMNQAAMRIKRGENPQKVSIELGFRNYSTFYRAYKKQFDCSPANHKQCQDLRFIRKS